MTQIKPSRDEESLFIKAGIAGFVCAIVAGGLNGFDVAKIRLQNQSAAQQLAYQGMIRAMMKIYREEGIRGLAKGIEPSMLREITYSSIRIGGYEPIRRALSSYSNVDDPTNTSPLIKFSSAILSGGIGSALMSPLDLIKTRFQATGPNQSAPYRNTFHALVTIIRTEGLPGLYKGWIVTCSRAAVLNSAQLGSYDSIKHNVLMNQLGMQDGPALHLVAAMSAGILTTTAANPFDVVKTRYLSDVSGQFRSIPHCIQHTYRVDGLRGFFKGWTPAYWRLGPHTVLAFLLIEEIRTWLGMNTI